MKQGWFIKGIGVAVAVLPAALFLAILPAVHAAPAKMPPGAYLEAPAPTVNALVNQVKSHPEIETRYKKIWQTGGNAVLARIGGVHLTRLAHDQVLKVYYTRKTGAWGYKVRSVAKGTPVFAAKDGTPVLLQVCGNPVHGLEKAQLSVARAAKRFSPSESDTGLVYDGTDIDLNGFVSALAEPQTTAYAEHLNPDLASDTAGGLDDSLGSPGSTGFPLGLTMMGKKKKSDADDATNVVGILPGLIGALLHPHHSSTNGGAGITQPTSGPVVTAPVTASPVTTSPVTTSPGGSSSTSPIGGGIPRGIITNSVAAPEPPSGLLGIVGMTACAGVARLRRRTVKSA